MRVPSGVATKPRMRSVLRDTSAKPPSGTWQFTDADALSVEYAHAYARQVAGEGSIPPGVPPGGLGGGETNLRMHEDMLGVARSRRV